MNLFAKPILATFCCAGMVVAPVALASVVQFDDYAKVVRSVPQVEKYNQPREECHTEYIQVQQQPQRSVGGAIIGGIAGGILGNQVGGGNGKKVATAAGAIAGAIVGDRIDNNDSVAMTTEQPIRQCRMIDHWQSRTVGYQVTYEYRGRTYTTDMPYDPGDRVKLQVSLTPR